MKQKNLFMAAAVALLCSSCVIGSLHETTGNPVGSKVGYVKRKVRKDFEGVSDVARLGGITKIGTIDIKWYASGKVSIKVTGE